MARLDYTLTGSWRVLPVALRLDFTRSGTWRILPGGVGEAFTGGDREDAAASTAPQTGDFSGALEVRDIDPAKWDEIAPLFQRS